MIGIKLPLKIMRENKETGQLKNCDSDAPKLTSRSERNPNDTS